MVTFGAYSEQVACFKIIVNNWSYKRGLCLSTLPLSICFIYHMKDHLLAKDYSIFRLVPLWGHLGPNL